MFLNSENDEKKILLNEGRHEFFDIERQKTGTHQRPLPIPKFILDQTSLIEKNKLFKVFCCFKIIFCYNSYKKNLVCEIKNKDLGFYYNLKNLASQMYDSENSAHEDSLKFLNFICLKAEPSEDLINKEWTKIGFQVNFY